MGVGVPLGLGTIGLGGTTGLGLGVGFGATGLGGTAGLGVDLGMRPGAGVGVAFGNFSPLFLVARVVPVPVVPLVMMDGVGRVTGNAARCGVE